MIDICLCLRYTLGPIPLTYGTPSGHSGWRSGSGSCGHGLVTCAPGRLRDNARPALRPACEELRCTEAGGGRVTPASEWSAQEARTGAERRRSFAAASAAVERREASASRWTRCRIARCGQVGTHVYRRSASFFSLRLGFRGFGFRDRMMRAGTTTGRL